MAFSVVLFFFFFSIVGFVGEREHLCFCVHVNSDARLASPLLMDKGIKLADSSSRFFPSQQRHRMNHWIASSEEKVGIRTEIKQSSPLQPQSFQKHRHPSSPNAIAIITLLTRLEVGRGEIFEQGSRGREGQRKRNYAGGILPRWPHVWIICNKCGAGRQLVMALKSTHHFTLVSGIEKQGRPGQCWGGCM